MSRKLALIIGNSEFDDGNLAQLTTPSTDANALAEILRDPEIGGFDQVEALVNQPSTTIRRAISGFFVERERDDLLLLYFSGHGIRSSTPNVVPERAAGRFYVRAANAGDLAPLKLRVEGCFRAGAAATGAEVEIRWDPADYLDIRFNEPLATAFRSNAERLGRVFFPFEKLPASIQGSTDMGNVSQRIPSIHPMLAAAPLHCTIHNPEFAKWAASGARRRRGHRRREGAGHDRARFPVRRRASARRPRGLRDREARVSVRSGGAFAPSMAAASPSSEAAHFANSGLWIVQ